MSKFSSLQLSIVSSGPLFVIGKMADKEDLRGNVVNPGETFFADMSDRRVPEVTVDGGVTWRPPLANEFVIPKVDSVIEVTGRLLDALETGQYRRASKWALADDCACAEKLQDIVLADLAAKSAAERQAIEKSRREAALLIACRETVSALRLVGKQCNERIPGTVVDIVPGHFIVQAADGRYYVAPGSSYCFPWVRSTRGGPEVRIESTPKPGVILAPKVNDGVIITASTSNADTRHSMLLASQVVNAEAFGKAHDERLRASTTLDAIAGRCKGEEKARKDAVLRSQRPAKAGRKQKQRV